MGNKFLSSIAAAAILSTGLFFTGCTSANETSTPKVEKHADHKKLTIIKYDKALELYKNKTALFLDARPMKLYKKSTIMGAMYMSTKEYANLKQYLPADKNTALVTFCNGFACEKSDVLAEKLQKDGYTNVLVYKGGEPEWAEKKQPLMAVKKECKAAPSNVAYKPELPATEVAGVNIHLLAEDGEANEDGLIDQFWFNEQIKNGTVPKGVTIVDVRKAEKYAASHIEGAISVPFKDDVIDTSKLPEDGVIVFYCNTGLKSTDSRMSIEDDDLLERVFIFDATYKCDKDTYKNCTITPNEPL